MPFRDEFNIYDPETPEVNRTYKIILIILGMLVFVLIIRLWDLQIYRGAKLEYYSQSNHLKSLIIYAPRGHIYDRDGFLLAGNTVSYSLYITPPEFHKNEEAMLSDITGIMPVDINDKLSDWDGFSYTPVLIDPYLSWKEMSVILANKLFLQGVNIEWQTRRKYTFSKAMSHIIGYVREVNKDELDTVNRNNRIKYSPGDFIGKYGIEKEYNDKLVGIDGATIKLVDVTGKEIKTYSTINPIKGSPITLTIDARLQDYTAKLMAPHIGCAIAMDPTTGAVLAMVSEPSFDINDLSSHLTPTKWDSIINNPFHPLENKCIQAMFAPGSTYKPVIAVAGLQDNVISPAYKIFDPGYFKVGNQIYHDWKKGGHGWVDMHKAIVQSCDTYFYRLGALLGVDRIAEYARLFGFGRLTGIDLPSEKAGIVPTSKWKEQIFHEPWYAGDTPPVAIGQGYDLVTPLQLLVAYVAIANGGNIMKPHLLFNRFKTPGDYITSKLGVSENILNIVKKGLLGVVNEPGGTAPSARIKGISVSGKTGTAQVIKESVFKNVPESKIPFKFRDNGWFVTYAPSDNPRIAVVVLIEHEGHGGSSCAPIARNMMDFYLHGDKIQ
ncbi:MAG: penicillin-binding protein 2 [Deltaproteobacteria bacterium]|nr:penicillin-binding protein 2 [Deltaproteobacteria bacterium]MCL5791818.1 penicillin-binding protein 2 [Deltaproteobacteria bacterium]